MVFRRSWMWLAGMMLAVSCFVCGCAAMYHSYYKRQYINGQVESYTYSTDFNYVWQQARTLLFTSGYMVIGEDRRTATIETDWGHHAEHTMRRYMVTGYTFGDGRSTVHFDYFEDHSEPDQPPVVSTGRDYEMEYALIRMVEPGAWAEIESGANRYADSKTAD